MASEKGKETGGEGTDRKKFKGRGGRKRKGIT
jgi:hypothetical protein